MSLAPIFTQESIKTLYDNFAQIQHCVDQLAEEDIWWRPHVEMNAVGNILLHVAGNVRQWIICGAGNRADHRDRPAEFAQRDHIPKAKLIAKLEETIEEAVETISKCSESELARVRHVQHWDVSGLSAIYHSVSHFYGHTQEIIYITRLRLGDKYRFRGLSAKSQ